jgi:endonuclease YncB( thermonuclease family)
MSRLRRPTRKAVLWGLAGIVGISIIGNATGGEEPATVPGTLTAAQSGMPSASAAPLAAPLTGALPASGTTPAASSAATASAAAVRVTHVADGDTFDIATGETVRVLGIDSCEAGTGAGPQATSDARAVLAGAQVTLRAEPGVDRDRYGRLLRYVDVPGTGDFGEYMVTRKHTGVYEGRNDAAPEYVSRLRSLDRDGRVCDTPKPTRAPAPVVEDNDRRDAPAPRSDSDSSRSGGGSASYSSCKAAKAAGDAPLYRGQPGYSGKLDRDGDGVACE